MGILASIHTIVAGSAIERLQRDAPLLYECWARLRGIEVQQASQLEASTLRQSASAGNTQDDWTVALYALLVFAGWAGVYLKMLLSFI